jgi:hypothetical protein
VISDDLIAVYEATISQRTLSFAFGKSLPPLASRARKRLVAVDAANIEDNAVLVKPVTGS